MAHHAPHANHETAATTRRILVGLLVLVVIGAVIGTLLGVSLAKGFAFLDLSKLGAQFSGKN